ncbi:hypothetical protein Tco_0444574 [Tanacetum coccineum]
MSSDSASSEEPDSPEAAPASPDYVLGPEEPEQAPPSLDYIPGPEYPGYLAPANDEIVAEDQPYADDASPIALSPSYVADSDPEEDAEEDSKDGPVDYPADGGDDDDDDDSSDDDEEEEASEEEEEEHLALAESFVALAAPMPFPSEAEVERLLTLPTPPPSPLISLSPPSPEERLARCLAAPALPSSPLPRVPHPYGSPNHVCAPQSFRAAMGRLKASTSSTHHPLHPSPPLPPLPLPASLFIPPLVDHKEDIPEAKLPPPKWLCLTTLTSRFEVGESSNAAARPTGGHRANYGFIDTLDAKTRRQRAEEVVYGIRDVWVDPAEAVEKVAPTILKGVNARVTELAEVQEDDTQDLYALVEDAHDRQTCLSQRVDGHLSAALGHIQALQAREPTHADDPEAIYDVLYYVMSILILLCVVIPVMNNMPPKRTSASARVVAAAARVVAAAARAAAIAVAAVAPMTIVAIEQLIEARVSEALANHETL